MPFDLLGTVALLKDYKKGDVVQYGAMYFRPIGGSSSGKTLMISQSGDRAAYGICFPGGPHKALLVEYPGSGVAFYCS